MTPEHESIEPGSLEVQSKATGLKSENVLWLPSSETFLQIKYLIVWFLTMNIVFPKNL